MPSLNEKKRIISRFLQQCNDYADRMVGQYHSQTDELSATEMLTIQDKITHWCAYKAFNEHTLAELKTDTLDHWLRDDISSGVEEND